MEGTQLHIYTGLYLNSNVNFSF